MGKICVSLAASSPEDLTILLQKATLEAADYVEIRFDYLHTVDIHRALAELIQNKICHRSVFTLRPPSEGGNFTGPESERVKLFKKLALARPMLLDVELNTLKENIGLLNFFEQNQIPFMVSWHNFLGTPSKSDLLIKVNEMRKYSRFIKLVTTAKTVADALNVISLYDAIKNINLIAFAMGEVGVLSRLLCTLYGNAPFTYASLDAPVAPGQLSIHIMRKLYEGIMRNTVRNCGESD
ncbi:MAG: type I 3-dehydroquinate dehydratase [Thermoproteota archaeon]|nr:type I 3-dehydroquinate dehydratase [Thermoproteota archaeon]